MGCGGYYAGRLLLGDNEKAICNCPNDDHAKVYNGKKVNYFD